MKPLNPFQNVATRQRNLPHWEQDGCSYFLTWRLADSLPAPKLKHWQYERDLWLTHNPKPWSDRDWAEYNERFAAPMQDWLDAGHGSCVLRRPEVRDLLTSTLHFFDGQRYHLNAFVIMPNHVHVLVTPRAGWSLSQILHAWKGFSSRQINAKLGQHGALWQEETFDHVVRSEVQWERFHRYLAENPVKAGLKEDEFTYWRNSTQESSTGLPACEISASSQAGKPVLPCLAAALLMLGTVFADTVSESTPFNLDTRDDFTHLAAESSALSFDTRLFDGLSGTQDTGTFVLDTRTTKAQGLQLAGATSVAPGSVTAYQVLLSGVEVTNACTLGFVGTAPTFAGIGGSTLFVDKSAPANSMVQLVATYRNAGGQIVSAPMNITVEQASTPIVVASMTGANPSGSNYTVTVTGSATGGTPPYSYNWDTTGQGTYGDLAGSSGSYNVLGSGTYSATLKVTDASGVKVYKKATVTLDKPVATVQQPKRVHPVGDVGGGAQVYDQDGHVFQFDTGRTAKGLIVVTHGLYSTGLDSWVRDMTHRIDSRLGADAPNIMAYDWGRDSDPSGQINPVALGLLDGLGKVYGIITPEQAVKAGTRALLGKATDYVLTNPADIAEKADFTIDAAYIRPIGQSHGTILASWLWLQGNAGLINPDKPIHLIGHSAGGFCMGECALYLKQHPLSNGKVLQVDRVTMLDTPFPIASHMTQLPNPTVVERVISSYYGGLEFPTTLVVPTNNYTPIKWLGAWWTRFDAGDAGHGLSHVWYRRTVQQGGETNAADLDGYGTDGFVRSPFAGGYVIPRSSLSPFSMLTHGTNLKSSGLSVTSIASSSSLQSVSGFSTFGSVVATGSSYRLTEAADAGLFKSLTVPIGAQALRLRFQFVAAGDGDFISVKFGDKPDLYLALDTALSRDSFTTVDVPLDGLAGETGNLVISLVSRGAVNAIADVADIQFVISDDPDHDGLTTAQEIALGTDPLKYDTDGDGISDYDEVNLYHTNPLKVDTDGDGIPDGAEIAAGTDPNRADSYFRVTDIHRTPTGSMALTWPCVAGKSYQVWRSTDITFASYDTIISGLNSVGSTLTYTDTLPPVSSGAVFYRVALEQ